MKTVQNHELSVHNRGRSEQTHSTKFPQHWNGELLAVVTDGDAVVDGGEALQPLHVAQGRGSALRGVRLALRARALAPRGARRPLHRSDAGEFFTLKIKGNTRKLKYQRDFTCHVGEEQNAHFAH